MVTYKAIEQLSSLPHMLVQILDALQRDADVLEIGQLIRQDAAVSSKLLAAANAAHPSCHTLEQALGTLTDQQLRSLLVSHGLQQFFQAVPIESNSQIQAQLWKSALACAHFARVLATLTSYHSPDEAYVCGLLANLGQSVLLEEYEQAYSQLLKDDINAAQRLEKERELFGHSHNTLAADLMDGWRLSSFITDAIRYQHEPLIQIQDAHHLVKIIYCAKLAANTGAQDPQLLDTAEQLFGLNEALSKELYSRNSADINKLASQLQLDDSASFNAARSRLGQQLAELTTLSQIGAAISQASNPAALSTAIDQCLLLNFGISRSLLFHYDPATGLLSTRHSNPPSHADFKLVVEPGRSLSADSLLENQTFESNNKRVLSVIDRQLLHFCEGDILSCWPLQQANNPVGVLVFALNKEQQEDFQQKQPLLSGLCRQIAISLSSLYQNPLLSSTDNSPSPSAYQHKIQEAVHEASNPLSIIHNYLEMLRIKLGNEHNANESLGLIKEEIERVGDILSKLKEQPDQHAVSEQTNYTTLNINRVIEDTSQIIKESICVAKKLTLQLHLDEQMAEIQGDSNHLKQILTNLLKNAAEALAEGGRITINSDSHTSFNGRDCVSISVIDDGPGLPREIMQKLFYPVTSSKGKGHSGLGLSIVKRLVEEMGGYIVCRSNKNIGTEFQILLPKTLTD